MVPVYLTNEGQGAYFQANILPVGTHVINGREFTIKKPVPKIQIVKSSRGKNKILRQKAATAKGDSKDKDGKGKGDTSSSSNGKKRKRRLTGKDADTSGSGKGRNAKRAALVNIQWKAYHRKSSTGGEEEVRLFSNSAQTDVDAVRKMRLKLGKQVTRGAHSKFREVVGDIALYRCVLQAHGDIELACTIFRKHLKIRQLHGLNDIRARLKRQGFTDESLRHFDSIDCAYGEVINQHGTFLMNAGVSLSGNPINMWWMNSDSLISMVQPEQWEMMLEFAREVMVRRQLQQDFLSVEQDRLVQTVVIGNGYSQPMWRFFVPGLPRNRILTLMNLASQFPSMVSRIFWMDPSWVVKSFHSSFVALFPKAQQSKLLFLSENFQSDLLHVLDTNTMSMLSQLRNSGSLNPDEELPIRSYGPTEIMIQPGTTHEVAVKIDSTTCSCITWDYTVESGSSLDFTMILLQDTTEKNDNSDDNDQKSSTAAHTAHNRKAEMSEMQLEAMNELISLPLKKRPLKKKQSATSSSSSSSSSASASLSSSKVLGTDERCLREICLTRQKSVNGAVQGGFRVPFGTRGLILFRWTSPGGLLYWSNTSMLYHIELESRSSSSFSSKSATTFTIPVAAPLMLDDLDNDDFDNDDFDNDSNSMHLDDDDDDNSRAFDVNGDLILDSSLLLHTSEDSHNDDKPRKANEEVEGEEAVEISQSSGWFSSSSWFASSSSSSTSTSTSVSHSPIPLTQPTLPLNVSVAYSGVDPVLRSMCDAVEVSKIISVRAQIADLVEIYSIRKKWLEVVGDVALLRYVRCSQEVSIVGIVRQIRWHCAIRKRFKLDIMRSILDPDGDDNFDRWELKDLKQGPQLLSISGIRIIPNLNADSIGVDRGCADPIHLCDPIMTVMTKGVHSLGEDGYEEYIAEQFVRRQMQLDRLSRAYGRLSMVQMIGRGSPGGLWRALVAGSTRNMFSVWAQIQSTTPGVEAGFHLIEASWIFRKFYHQFMFVFPFNKQLLKLHASDYRQTLLKYIDQRYIAMIDGEDGEENNALPLSSSEIVPLGKSSSSSSSVAKQRFFTPPNIMERCTICLNDYMELMIEVDPDVTSAVRWKYFVEGGLDIDFQVILVQDITQSTITRDGTHYGKPCLRQVPAMPPISSNCDDGMVEWKSKTKGLLILRWSHRKTSLLKEGDPENQARVVFYETESMAMTLWTS